MWRSKNYCIIIIIIILVLLSYVSKPAAGTGLAAWLARLSRSFSTSSNESGLSPVAQPITAVHELSSGGAGSAPGRRRAEALPSANRPLTVDRKRQASSPVNQLGTRRGGPAANNPRDPPQWFPGGHISELEVSNESGKIIFILFLAGEQHGSSAFPVNVASSATPLHVCSTFVMPELLKCEAPWPRRAC